MHWWDCWEEDGTLWTKACWVRVIIMEAIREGRDAERWCAAGRCLAVHLHPRLLSNI